MDSKKRRELRSQAQALRVTVTIGKAGVNEATADELRRHLKAHKLVKVRLLPASAETGDEAAQVDRLTAATGAHVVERRGHTAVFWKV